MAKLNIQTFNKTLLEVDKALEAKQAGEDPRTYLGMSVIGESCWRKLFYSFRHAEKRVILADGIRAIEDGYTQESVMAERLRLLPDIELITMDPLNPKKQIGFSLLMDHFCGHCDGMIKGIEEAPQTWHVWEHKSVNEKKFQELHKHRLERGEKNALDEWDQTYYAQAQIYMHMSKLKRHYLTVSSPGGRHYMSVRTEYNKKYAEDIIEKARVIIFDNWNLPAQMSSKREFYRCKWCEFQENCHNGKFAAINCKTCRYLEPVENGENKCLLCENYSIDEIILPMMMGGCSSHIYNPALIQAKLIEHQKDCCIYETGNLRFANCSTSGMPELRDELDQIYTSQQLRDKVKFVSNIKSTEKEKIKKEKRAWE
jgi:hypothetical protein